MAPGNLKNRVDTELSSAIVRLMVLVPLAVIVWSDGFIEQHQHIERLPLMRPLILAFMAISAAFLLAVVLHPKTTPSRSVLGMCIDVFAISSALFLGESAVAPVSAFYLWTILGSGFVLGVRYLYVATSLSLFSFSVVYLTSGYWQNNATFSLTIATMILLPTPYLASLLGSLHRAKNLISYQANHDSLTGALNRRAFKAELKRFIRQRIKDRHHLVMFCDLDQFKTVNDTAGHAAGDQVLTDVAKLFRQNLTKMDVLGRLGGDEFCVLLKARTWDQARSCAENIRNSVAAYRLAWGTQYFNVSISIGIAPNAAVTDEDSWIRLADAACYAAKKSGRNQVHMVDPRLGCADTQRIRNLNVLRRELP